MASKDAGAWADKVWRQLRREEVVWLDARWSVCLGVLDGLDESSSSAGISRYESGAHEPSLSFTESLAKVLRLPAAYFFCNDDRLAEIILAYADMSEAQRQVLHTKAVELAEH